MGAVRGRFILMPNFFLSLLMGDGLICMLYMRHVGMLRALFRLDIGVWSGSLLVSLIYEIGCLVELCSVRDLGKIGN